MDSEWISIIVSIIVPIILVIGIMVGTNSCSANKWNDGMCPSCNVHYELRGAHSMLKYYVCPECHQEVERY